VIKERLHHGATKPTGGITFELNCAEAATFSATLPMIPRA
jgi:hypothetical protein